MCSGSVKVLRTILIYVVIIALFTVRGMMYYRKALELQAFLDMAKDDGISNSSVYMF